MLLGLLIYALVAAVISMAFWLTDDEADYIHPALIPLALFCGWFILPASIVATIIHMLRS